MPLMTAAGNGKDCAEMREPRQARPSLTTLTAYSNKFMLEAAYFLIGQTQFAPHEESLTIKIIEQRVVFVSRDQRLQVCS
jgi:hypothetical protein